MMYQISDVEISAIQEKVLEIVKHSKDRHIITEDCLYINNTLARVIHR